MSVRIGINGFGRIGRLAFRAAWNSEDLQITHINEVAGDINAAAHLLEFDSVHGRWSEQPVVEGNCIRIGSKQVSFSQSKQPAGAPWRDCEVDIVLECSGKFLTLETLTPYFAQGVKKVLVAAPVKEAEAINIVLGCNEHKYQPELHKVITAASCTTNCLAPVVKVIHEKVGIKHGVITTIHDVTNTQVLVDAPHKDLRRARSALNSLIPTSTGSATAIGIIYPELSGKLNGLAVRVPLLNASLTDCVFEVERQTTVEEVNQYFREAADGELRGILGFEERPLVSADFLNDTRSSIIDGPSTMVVNGTQVKVLAWYDNEMGYAQRLVELAELVVKSL